MELLWGTAESWPFSSLFHHLDWWTDFETTCFVSLVLHLVDTSFYFLLLRVPVICTEQVQTQRCLSTFLQRSMDLYVTVISQDGKATRGKFEDRTRRNFQFSTTTATSTFLTGRKWENVLREVESNQSLTLFRYLANSLDASDSIYLLPNKPFPAWLWPSLSIFIK